MRSCRGVERRPYLKLRVAFGPGPIGLGRHGLHCGVAAFALEEALQPLADALH